MRWRLTRGLAGGRAVDGALTVSELDLQLNPLITITGLQSLVALLAVGKVTPNPTNQPTNQPTHPKPPKTTVQALARAQCGSAHRVFGDAQAPGLKLLQLTGGGTLGAAAPLLKAIKVRRPDLVVELCDPPSDDSWR